MEARTVQALALMTNFAARTGVGGSVAARRYLWTDAFAVCNWLGLARATGELRHIERALELVDQVHRVLARHRPDDSRTGWISGLEEQQGAHHPTRGGLRIGKPLPERGADEPMDERLEWDRDGQYFHYLTKWMHALDQVARATGELRFNRWARELADTAHRAFTYAPRGSDRKRMYWKLSIDLSRPLVASMGQHDPLDGFITCAQLQATAPASEPALSAAIADFGSMIDAAGLATDDPLGLGGLLIDAYRVIQLERQGAGPFALLEPLLEAALAGLGYYSKQRDLRRPATHRLAFRELGLAIGLAALERGEWTALKGRGRALLDRLVRFMPLRSEIEMFWRRPEHRRVDSWLEHENINDVMLATGLEPQGFLIVPPPARV